MSLDLMLPTDLIAKVRQRLESGWVLVSADDPSLLSQFEDELYPPGTPEAEGFEFGFGPWFHGGPVLLHIVLAKKTDRLREKLREAGLLESEWTCLLEVVLHAAMKNSRRAGDLVLVEAIYAPPGSREWHVERILRYLEEGMSP